MTGRDFDREQELIRSAFDDQTGRDEPEVKAAVETAIAALDRGEVRVARRSEHGSWQVEEWVKQAILLSLVDDVQDQSELDMLREISARLGGDNEELTEILVMVHAFYLEHREAVRELGLAKGALGWIHGIVVERATVAVKKGGGNRCKGAHCATMPPGASRSETIS